MGSEQMTDGTVSIATASQIVIGDGTNWAVEISLPAVFKVDADGESTISIGTIISATRLHLAANYQGSTGSGLDYMIMRSFTSRGFWRPLQGDNDFAEILSQETIDKIDDDIALLFTSYSTGSAVGTNASSFAINMDATLGRFWTDNLTASRDYRLPNQNATLAGLGVVQEFSADQTFNASVWIKGNASIDGALNVNTLGVSNLAVDDINATTGDINTLHSATLTANNLNATIGDIVTLHSDTLTADNLNATTGDIETLHSNSLTASDIAASSMKISDLTNNRIVVVGADGELEDDANFTWDGSLFSVNGNMAITGSTVIVTASNISVKDPLVVLAKDQSGAPAYDSGLIVERGTSQNVGMFWDESVDKWVMAYTNEDGTTSGAVTIASYGDLRVKGFQSESINASVLNASTGDINTLHSAIFTTNDLNATTGDIATLHSAILTANSLNATTSDIETLHSSILTASNLTASKLTLIGEVQSDLLQTEDILTDFVVSGLLPATSADLISNISTGQAYVMGKRIVKANTTAHTYTGNRDTYVDISKSALLTFSGVLNASSAPSLAASSIRLAKTVTNATAITSVTDLRELDFTIGTSSRDININRLHTATLIVNNINATTGDIHTLHANTFTASTYTALTRANASIDILQSDVVRANASIDISQADIVHVNASITRANASIASNDTDITRANASITTNINDISNVNASIANLIPKATFNAKGDVLTASADDTPSILPVGANDTILTADSAQIGGLKWSVPAGGGNVVGPATNTDEYIPQWNGADSKALKNGFAKTDLVLQAAMTNANASIDALQPNPQLKTANYQILTTDNMILASGNVIITAASASAKHEIRIGNRSLDSNASIRVKKSGGDTIENNASLNLRNKYDTVCLIGDGTNTHFQF